MAAPQQALLMAGAGAAANNDYSRLLFNGANGGSVFTDDGTGGMTWTRTGIGVTTDTSKFKEGTASLNCNSSGSYLYATNTFAPPGDFFAGIWLYYDNSTSRYVYGTRDSGATVAGSQFFWYINASNGLYAYVSDGTTLILNGAHHASWPTTGGANGWVYLSLQRHGNTVYARVDGTNAVSATMNNALNATSTLLDVNSTQAGSGLGTANFDMLQMRYSDPYAGADFTPPTTPIP